MRHKVSGFKLRRDSSSRKALLRNLVTSVIEQERVITTVTKAKAAKPLVEKMITLAKADKDDQLHARREAAAFLQTPAAVKKLFDNIGARFSQRDGGYTRITRIGWRKGDGAEEAVLELVDATLVKRAADRAKRREERMQALREGREEEESQ